jgi:RNA polymerase-binding transcription factor DksA
MNAQLTRLQRLDFKFRELQERLQRIHRDRSRANGALDADSEERASQTFNDEVLDRLDSSTRNELQAVEHAIEHLRAGRGDHCEVCGESIEAERLAVVLHATRCRACAGIRLQPGSYRHRDSLIRPNAA